MVGELDDNLHVSVRAGFEFLDEVLAVALVGLDAEVVLGDQGVEVFRGAVDGGEDVLIEVEFYGKGFRKVGADVGVGEIEFVGENEHADVVVQTVGGGSIHHRVFAEETGGTIVVDNELKGFVVPAILAVAMPVLMCAFFESYGCGVIEANDEGGGLDGFEGGGVSRVGG